jgi:diguanylate cyclase (GGDEF)-like protein/PAS domain S-box-containing protein
MTELLHLTGDDSLVVDPRPPVETAGLNYRLFTFDPQFQNAIRESLLAGSAVEIHPRGIVPPENEGQLPQFCEGALAACPLRIEVLLLDGRSVQVSLQWLVADTTIVRLFAQDVTAQKQSEPSETAPQPLSGFDRALEGIYRTTADGRLLAANQSFARMLGFDDVDQTLAAIADVSRDLWEDPDQRTIFLEELEKHGSIEGYECRLKGKDGARIWASVNSRRVCGERGALLYLEGFIQDITVKKEAEKLLRDSEERYRASFEQAAVGILHTSFEGRIMRCNRRFGEIVGYAPEELVGLTFQEITPPGDRPPSSSAVQNLIGGAVPYFSFEKRYVKKDGGLTWVNLNITIQRDSEGHPVHFITMVQDINARKEVEDRLANAQESLRKSEERYRTAFQMTLDAVNLNRLSDGTFVECNRAFLSISGFRREDIIGRSSLEIDIWADPRDRQKLLETLKNGGVCRNLEARFRKKNGDVIWGLMSASLIELDGVQSILSITRDISEAKKAENEIKRLAFYDPLTGLPNRRMLLDRLRQSIRCGRRTGRKCAVLFIDLDNFKTLNDSLGHHTGDLLLQEVARRLVLCLRESDTAARIGGDEFVIIVENLSPDTEEAAAQAKAIAEKILNQTSEPYMLNRHECMSTASIGITVFGEGKQSTSEILQQADIAMYQAKAAGRNTLRFFAPALQAAVNLRASLEEEIHTGIREKQFALWYQPQVENGRIVGAEALLRWMHPRRGVLLPAEFIPLAEETGLIVSLGRLVLELACAQAAQWAGRCGGYPIPVAVNVSARQFRQADFVNHVLATLDQSGVDPKNLKLEITESMLLDNLEETVAIMETLKSHGLQFSLDDFGTGYSSLAYLKRLPLDQLKIDRTFVRDIRANAANGAVAQAIISLARALGLVVIAEGVETDEQRELLAHFGCSCFQGFLFSRALPPADFETLLGISANSDARA